jgi:hypothetical protein
MRRRDGVPQEDDTDGCRHGAGEGVEVDVSPPKRQRREDQGDAAGAIQDAVN